MDRKYMIGLIVLIAAASFSSMGQARERCPEGRTLAGACVMPGLAQLTRKQTIVFSQIDLSKTAPIYLPNEDRKYLIPFNYFEMLKVLNEP